MHELSIAQSIVDIAEATCLEKGAKKASKIGLVIGQLSGVELSSLEFVWPVAVRETVLEKAEKVIDPIPGRAKCLECQQEYFLDKLYDECPSCGGYFKDILQGKEIQIQYLEIEF